MKLIEALNIINSMQRREGSTLRCALATGFTPLHLKTFLAAELGLVFADRNIEITDGLYGDLCGNINWLTKSEYELGIVLIEWPDLDPRLGLRNTARWSANELNDILETSRERALQIRQSIAAAGQLVSVTVCMPTLPLLPLAFTPGWQAGSFEVELRATAQSIQLAAAEFSQVRFLSSQRIDQESPLNHRHDVRAEMLNGFPYHLHHATTLATLLARLARRPVPMKGVITDLDDTLWHGILGEDGVHGISWDLEHHSQMHAFYQRFLGVLASEGVMIGIASKNDPELVTQALQRDDLAISAANIFPIEANWKTKSQSVARILKAWNVGADSVVFIDDSPLELEEVKAVHPQIECIQFPTRNNSAILQLTMRLRDLFGRSAVSEEDALRVESIRRQQPGVNAEDSYASEAFLEQSEAEVGFNFAKDPVDARALDLVSKTNQFSLNGKRHTESSWNKFLRDPDSFLLVASYRDKFGPLDKIAVMAGSLQGTKVTVSTWVMSCRAFSRRIEHKCLAELIGRFRPDEIVFDFLRTEQNGPFCEFFGEMTGTAPAPSCTISRDVLDRHLNTLLNDQKVANG
ncbi:MAG TPA: HAD-IIIC family phosphatase [Terracidiphilus sp.]|jgi:FkbH-like protein|nr:HAD-IIIC family phosphatase [Terracidiphilus sp.]